MDPDEFRAIAERAIAAGTEEARRVDAEFLEQLRRAVDARRYAVDASVLAEFMLA